MLAACLPAAAAGATDPFFGTLFDDNANLTREQRALDMDHQAATGLGVIRVTVSWDQVEKTWTPSGAAGVFDWNALDEIVADAAQRDLRILPVVFNTPQFYKPAGTPADVESPPADVSYFGRFMRKLAQRYGPNGSFWCSGFPPVCKTPYLPITSWQIWNEPNYPFWWKGSTDPNPNEYLDLLRTAYPNLKLADPNAEVVMAGLAPTTGGGNHTDYRTYLKALYDAGAAPFFDTLAMHAYGSDVETAAIYPRTVRQIADANADPNTPIWIKSTDCQAALVHKAAVEWRRLRDELKLRGAIQFQWRDVATTQTAWPYYAGLNPPDFSAPPKPALGELANAIALRTPDPRYTVGTACDPGSPEDKALGRAATASSAGTAPSGEAGSEPKRAVDGLSNTRWISDPMDDQEIQVDLGSSRVVDTVTLNWSPDYATHYAIATSLDGTSFTPAADVTINMAGPQTNAFTPRRARYVRVHAFARSSPGAGIGLWDFNVFGPADVPPSNTVTPTVSGTPKVGKTLSCSSGTWTGSEPLSFTYRWLRNGAPITGAISNAYTAKWADAGRKVSCRVRASNAAGSASATSLPVTVPFECLVPAVKGKRLAAAKTAIVAAHCKVGTVTKKKAPGIAGRVLWQSRRPGKRLPVGSKVALIVSKH